MPEIENKDVAEPSQTDLPLRNVILIRHPADPQNAGITFRYDPVIDPTAVKAARLSGAPIKVPGVGAEQAR
jgi:hypothetical protein